jgi:hypothetical protein
VVSGGQSRPSKGLIGKVVYPLELVAQICLAFSARRLPGCKSLLSNNLQVKSS